MAESFVCCLLSMKCVFVKGVENETRSDPPDESPFLLSAAARVSHGCVYSVSGPCINAAFSPLFGVSLSETVWAPLDLPTLVTENIPNPPDRIFWKAVLLLPSDHESVASVADR